MEEHTRHRDEGCRQWMQVFTGRNSSTFSYMDVRQHSCMLLCSTKQYGNTDYRKYKTSSSIFCILGGKMLHLSLLLKAGANR